MSTSQPSRDDTREVSGFQEITERAYQIWVEGGRKEGTSLSDWLQAEAELRNDPDSAAIPTEPGLIARETIRGEIGGNTPANREPVLRSDRRQRRAG